jgi:hypothetical protein
MTVRGHAFDVKVFDADDIEPRRQVVTELVQSILADVGHALVQLGELGFRFLPVRTAFAFAGQGAVEPPQTGVQPAVRFWSRVDSPVESIASAFRPKSTPTTPVDFW